MHPGHLERPFRGFRMFLDFVAGVFQQIPNAAKQPMSTTSFQNSTAVRASPLKFTGTDAMSSAKGFKHGSFQVKESQVDAQMHLQM